MLVTSVLRQAGETPSFESFVLNLRFRLRLAFCGKNPARTQSRRTLVASVTRHRINEQKT